jgi:hypothetical protein
MCVGMVDGVLAFRCVACEPTLVPRAMPSPMPVSCGGLLVFTSTIFGLGGHAMGEGVAVDGESRQQVYTCTTRHFYLQAGIVYVKECM